MQELTLEQVKSIIKSDGSYIIYFYTTMCGTCQLAEKMLHIVEETMKDVTLVKCNINYATEMATQYKLESVPCIAVFKKGNLQAKLYAFHSVNYLYEWIQRQL